MYHLFVIVSFCFHDSLIVYLVVPNTFIMRFLSSVVKEAQDVVSSLLLSQQGSNLQIPQSFHEVSISRVTH